MSEINYKYVNIKLGNHKPPVFKVIKNQDWIEFGVEPPYKNNYPKYLQSLFERANLHGAFLKAKQYYISGAGLTIDKSAKTVGDISELLQMLKETNSLGESISDILNKCVLDYVLFGGCYVEVNWSINGKKFEITHMPFNNLRRSVNNDGYWYSNDWSQSKQNQTKEKTELEFIPDYDVENGSGKQIYALKSYGIGTEYYPKPEYLGLVPCAEVETEISNYHLNAIKSGFHIGTIITFIGKPSPTEQDEIERQLKNKFQGTDAAGSLLLQFTRDKDGQPQITRLAADDLDKKFETLTKWVDQQLTAGHHMSPIIAGIKTEGQLGGRSEIDLAFDLFKNTWVKPNQKVLENWINKLYEFYGFEDRIRFKEVRPIAPFEYKDVLSYMTNNEIRELIGLSKLKEDTSEKQQQFNKSQTVEDIIISEFSATGEDASFYNVIESREITPEDFQSYATALEKSILAILEKDPLATDKSIGEALKKDESTITEAINKMIEDGLIEMGEKTQEGEVIRKAKVSSEGKSLAEESKVADSEVKYFYDWKTGFDNSDLKTSRPFCKKLMDLNRYYSREQIDAISAKVGLNVFMYGGGWWNMGNGTNSPSCRHIWKSVIVKRK